MRAAIVTMSGVLLVLMLVGLHMNIQRRIPTPATTKTVQQHDDFVAALARYADKDGFIMLAMVDVHWVDMTINFYETSLKPFGITNYLIVSLRGACDTLQLYGIHCYAYANITVGEYESSFMKNGFEEKMHYRSMFMSQALQAGYKVLITDTDAIFLKNPHDELCCRKSDVYVMWDSESMAAGFGVYKGEAASQVYAELAVEILQRPKKIEQSILNTLLRRASNQHKLTLEIINTTKVVSGLEYYEIPRRYFFDSSTSIASDNCLVVQNNWIVSKAAKIYRFKEMLQWVYDGEDKYYSESTRKYLTYKNNIEAKKGTPHIISQELKALKNALAIGEILNRTVILPKFHCINTMTIPCPLNFHIFISHFDKEFGGKYRESVFLLHPKVPSNIKNTISKEIIINIDQGHTMTGKGENTRPTILHDSMNRLTSNDIQWLFSSMRDISVLNFRSMNDIFLKFVNESREKTFREKTKRAFRSGAGYRQNQ